MRYCISAKSRVPRAWVALALVGGVLAGLTPARGADPSLEEYKRQIAQPLDVLAKQNAPVQDRRLAAAKVREWAKLRRRVVSEVYIQLDDPDEQVRLQALETLAELGPSGQETISHLIPCALHSPSEKERTLAIGALASVYSPFCDEMGPAVAKEVVATFQHALKDKSREVRLRAAYGLAMPGPLAKAVVPALAEAVQEKDAKDESGDKRPSRLRVSVAAVNTLARIGPDAKEAIPRLLELAGQGEDLDLQVAALGALGLIGDQDERVLPTLLAALKQPPLRSVAAQALGHFGPKRAKEIVPALLKALDTSDLRDKEYADLVQFFAINSLAKMGPEAKAAVPRLEAILKDPKTRWQAHMAAADALTQLRR